MNYLALLAVPISVVALVLSLLNDGTETRIVQSSAPQPRVSQCERLEKLVAEAATEEGVRFLFTRMDANGCLR